MGRKVLAALGGAHNGEARGRTVALLGLTFKPNTDDMRDAPSVAIATALADAGVTVRAHDPEGTEQARALMPDLTYCADPYEAATGADAVVIVTEWDAFRAIDLKRLKAAMAGDVLVDLRNIYRREAAAAAGFAYTAIGR
jgi:UDPglucose 6-dehydrogenase